MAPLTLFKDALREEGTPWHIKCLGNVSLEDMRHFISFYGWPPSRSAWLMGSFAFWVIDLRRLGPPLRARALARGFPSCSGSTSTLALMRWPPRATLARVAVGVFWSLGCRSSVFGASSPRKSLSDGFSGSFNALWWFLRLATRHRLRVFFSSVFLAFWVLFTFPLFFGFAL
jgi:hypothetical protein